MLDHRETERDLLGADDRREPLMHAQDVGVAARAAARDHLQTETGHMLRLVVCGGGRLGRRRERREERRRHDDHHEDRRLGDRVADERGARAYSRAKPRAPAEQVECADAEGREHEHDLHGERDPIRRLVQVVDQDEAVEGLKYACRDEKRGRDQRRDRETPHRAAQRSRVLRRSVAFQQQHAPQKRDDAARPHRDREHVNEIEGHALETAKRRRMRDEGRGHRRGDPGGERDHPARPERRERTDRHDATAGERTDGPHQRETRRDRHRGKDQTREGPDAEHHAETRRQLRALIENEREGPGDDERAREPQKGRLAARIGRGRTDEEHEEGGPKTKGDARV